MRGVFFHIEDLKGNVIYIGSCRRNEGYPTIDDLLHDVYKGKSNPSFHKLLDVVSYSTVSRYRVVPISEFYADDEERYIEIKNILMRRILGGEESKKKDYVARKYIDEQLEVKDDESIKKKRKEVSGCAI